MRYFLSIYVREDLEAARPESEVTGLMDAYWAYDDMLAGRGALIVGEALANTPDARTVRVRGGVAMTTDGPFAETKEQLGGFYVVEAGSEAEALEYAARCPSVVDGSGRVEVRAVRQIPPLQGAR